MCAFHCLFYQIKLYILKLLGFNIEPVGYVVVLHKCVECLDGDLGNGGEL